MFGWIKKFRRNPKKAKVTEPAYRENARTVSWLLQCSRCRFWFTLTTLETTPTVYRFCPRCGERTLY